MRIKLSKIAQVAILGIALASNAFADESGSRGFRFGFYGALPTDRPGILGLAGNSGNSAIGLAGSIGALFDLGNAWEFGLGIAIGHLGSETKSNNNYSTENGVTVWEIIPSASYAFSRGDILSWGAGLNLHFASYSISTTASGTTTTDEPKNMDIAFFPNFFVKAEPVKNFALGLKTGIMVDMLGEQEPAPGATQNTTLIDFKTELFLAFYPF